MRGAGASRGGPGIGRHAWVRPQTLIESDLIALALEATQGQMDGFFSQLLYKFHLEEVASAPD